MSGLNSALVIAQLARRFQQLVVKDYLLKVPQRCLSTQGTRTERPSSPPALLDFKQPHFSGSKSSFTSPCDLQMGVAEKQYICPSRLSVTQPSIAILDQAVVGKEELDCPTLPQSLLDIIMPEGQIQIISDPNTHNAPIKEARNIQKIRRRKMNRHLLKKHRKRMKFTFRRINLKKRRKKQAEFRAELDGIRQAAINFDPEEFIKKELEEARRGGFYINIMQSSKQ